jgi:enoyl-CoA hydratase/carnithine racemase
MQYINSERDGTVAVITLARGKANALNEALVAQIHLAVKEASSDGSVRAVVLASGTANFFSGGFDVLEVFS